MKRLQKILSIVTKIASVLFIVLFVYTATSKLLEFDGFKIQLGQSPIITAYADWVAWGIPLLELVIAALLLFPKTMLPAFYASFSLMTMFTTYIILILNFSDFIPCSCGGILEDLGWTEHIFFNISFVAMAIVAIYFLEHKQITTKTVQR